MRTRGWLLTGLLVAGCAPTRSTTQIDDMRVARLPVESRQHINDSQRNVDVAQSNVAAAKAALDEAIKFRAVADQELEAAKSSLEAARGAMEYGEVGRARARDYEDAIDRAQRQLFAARAKKDYADRLHALRDAQIDEQQAALEVARADLEQVKFEELQHRGLAKGLNAADFERDRRDARSDLANRRMRVAELQGDVAAMRTAWDERRRDFNTASSGPSIVTPPPPRPPVMHPTPPPASGANEGPTEGRSLPQSPPLPSGN